MSTEKSKDDNANGRGSGESAGQAQLPWNHTYTWELESLRQRPGTSSAEINRAARLDWRIYQTPAFFFIGDEPEAQPAWGSDGVVTETTHGSFKLVGSRRPRALSAVPDYLLNVRDDTHHVVGVVKDRYRVLQNHDAPAFLDRVVDSGDVAFETAGALHSGARVFWLVRLERVTAETASEPLDTYLLLENSHDGSTRLVVSAFAARPASQTTLVWRLPSAPRALTLRHTDVAKHQQVTADRALELGRAYSSELLSIRDRMLQTPVNDEQVQRFLAELVPTPKPIIKDGRVANQRGITMAENTKGVITQVYHHNESQENIRGTVWGLVQACQFYADHLSISRNTPDASAEENRLKRLFSGATLGGKAFSRALKLL